MKIAHDIAPAAILAVPAHAFNTSALRPSLHPKKYAGLKYESGKQY